MNQHNLFCQLKILFLKPTVCVTNIIDYIRPKLFNSRLGSPSVVRDFLSIHLKLDLKNNLIKLTVFVFWVTAMRVHETDIQEKWPRITLRSLKKLTSQVFHVCDVTCAL